MAIENDKAKIYFAAITYDIKTHNKYVRLWNSKRIYAKGRPGLVVLGTFLCLLFGSPAKALQHKSLRTADLPFHPTQRERATSAQQIRPYVMLQRQPGHDQGSLFGLPDRTAL